VELTPDQIVFWRWGIAELNATLVFTLVVDLVLVLASWLITRRITGDVDVSRAQYALEVVVGFLQEQIREITESDPAPLIPFVATLFLFIGVSNALTIVPFYQPPTASLSTATALALCVFVAVPYFGIAEHGLGTYLRHYLQPNPLMLPFNVVGELSRTLALAIRMFGNVMSGAVIAGILLALTPLVFPIVMQAFGLLTGLIQAYIYAILATVYIASAVRAREEHLEAPE
jgi:F-type H+-transporting ATPase subunit a